MTYAKLQDRTRRTAAVYQAALTYIRQTGDRNPTRAINAALRMFQFDDFDIDAGEAVQLVCDWVEGS